MTKKEYRVGATYHMTLTFDPLTEAKVAVIEVESYFKRYPPNPFETKLSEVRRRSDEEVELHLERYGSE